MEWINDDGGRAAFGLRGKAIGDCVCRSIAIATGLPYGEVYAALITAAESERPGAKRRRGKRSHPRSGVFKATIVRYLTALGWHFTPTMGIGTGCTVHLRSGELPHSGRLIVSCSLHYTAVINGVIHDTYNPSRGGTRCVYGYWSKP